MEESPEGPAAGQRRWRRRLPTRVAVLAGAFAGAFGLGAAGAAVAQSVSSPAASSAATVATTSPSTSSPSSGSGPMTRVRGGLGILGGGIHGQFTVRKSGGGYETIDTQSGQVTAVSSSSITVKSADGFSKTYAVTSNTSVNAGRDGISDVKTGDQVHVTAVENGSTPEAAMIRDGTDLKSSAQHFGFPTPPAPGAQQSTGSSSSTG